MTALDLIEIEELYYYPLYLDLDEGIKLIYFTKNEITIAEDVGGGMYATLKLLLSDVNSRRYMRVELEDGKIIKAIFERNNE